MKQNLAQKPTKSKSPRSAGPGPAKATPRRPAPEVSAQVAEPAPSASPAPAPAPLQGEDRMRGIVSVFEAREAIAAARRGAEEAWIALECLADEAERHVSGIELPREDGRGGIFAIVRAARDAEGALDTLGRLLKIQDDEAAKAARRIEVMK